MAVSLFCAGLQDIKSAAVGAFDLTLVPHIEIDTRMTERTLAAVTGNFHAADFNCLKRLHKVVSLLGWPSGIASSEPLMGPRQRMDDIHCGPRRNRLMAFRAVKMRPLALAKR